MHTSDPCKVFISYSHTDQKLRKKLEEHLISLTRSNRITIWQDQVIQAGGNWNDAIQAHLKEADVILLLVSSPFMASSYCWNDEVKKALERHQAGMVQVIPIILRSVDWKNTPLGHLQALPRDGKPVNQWSDPDTAFENIAQDIRDVVIKLQTTRQHGFQDTIDAYEGTYIIGVDIDRSHLTMILTDREANILQEETPGSFDTRAGAIVCLTRVADELQRFVEKSGVRWEQVVGIGLAMPGPLDRDQRRVLSVSQRVLSASQNVLSASQMIGWEGIDIPTYLEHKLKKKIPIYLDNDANMGVLGESRYGAGRGIADIVYIKIGIGIGAGFVINGHLHRGKTKAAGELGHIVVEEKGTMCTCGNQGCLETVAAEPAIVKDACAGISLRASSLGSPSPLDGYREKGDITTVIHAAQNNDDASQAALQRAGEWIGRALGTVINLFNPSMILLDGEVIRKTEFLLEALRHSAQESSLHATWSGVTIDICKLENPVAVGAVANVIDHLSKSTS